MLHTTVIDFASAVEDHPDLADEHTAAIASARIDLSWVPRSDGAELNRIVAVDQTDRIRIASIDYVQASAAFIASAAHQVMHEVLLQRHAEALTTARRNRDYTMVSASEHGVPQRLIAEATGVSQGRVAQIIAEVRQDYAADKARHDEA